MASVTFEDEIQGAASGGTLSTIILGIEGKTAKPSKSKFDPMYMLNDGVTSSNFRSKQASPLLLPIKQKDGTYLNPFLMSLVNFDAAKRSVALRNTGNSNLSFCEGTVHPDFKSSFVGNIGFMTGLVVLAVTPLRKLLMKMKKIPNPGEGPTLKQMERGFLRVTGRGIGNKGTEVRSCMYFDVDAGYRDTSRMLIESGLTLAKNSEKLTVGGGVYTPGFALGKVLLERLKASGTSFATKFTEVDGSKL